MHELFDWHGAENVLIEILKIDMKRKHIDWNCQGCQVEYFLGCFIKYLYQTTDGCSKRNESKRPTCIRLWLKKTTDSIICGLSIPVFVIEVPQLAREAIYSMCNVHGT